MSSFSCEKYERNIYDHFQNISQKCKETLIPPWTFLNEEKWTHEYI